MPRATSAISTRSRKSSTSGSPARIGWNWCRHASTSSRRAPCSTSRAGPTKTFSRTMAKGAERRDSKQRWAEPGSWHDWLVRWTKVILPSAVGVLIAVLALAPLGKKSDVSFILDKRKVQNAPERMRVEQARYVGTDDKGQQFTMIANRAVQPSSDVPLVDIRGMFARFELAQGPVLIAANQGHYNLDNQQVTIDGPVKVAGANGYRLVTRDVTVNLKPRQL